MKWLGYRVETQNYIDDTGVQVADVVVAFQHLEPKSLAEVRGDDRRSQRSLRLLLLGCLLEDGQLLRRESRGAAVAARHAARDREARRRDVRIRVDDRPRHRQAPHRHDAPPRHHLRPAAERERHHRAALLGSRVRAAEGQRRRDPGDGREAQRLLGDEARREPPSSRG